MLLCPFSSPARSFFLNLKGIQGDSVLPLPCKFYITELFLLCVLERIFGFQSL